MAKAFRLATVLRVRRLQEDLARQGLAVANRFLVAAEVDRNRRVEHYRSLSTPSNGLRMFEEFLREQQAMMLAADSVGYGENKLAEAKIHAARWREQYLVARKRVKVLEKLEHRRRLEENYEEARRETKLVDDVVTTRWAGEMAAARR